MLLHNSQKSCIWHNDSIQGITSSWSTLIQTCAEWLTEIPPEDVLQFVKLNFRPIEFFKTWKNPLIDIDLKFKAQGHSGIACMVLGKQF